MPIIDISLSPGRSPERLSHLARLVAEATSTALEVPQEKVRILMREVPDTHWSTAGVTTAQEKAEEAERTEPGHEKK